MQDPDQSDDINVRAARFLLARTVTTCAKCHAPTSVVALAVPPGHTVLDLDDGDDVESTAVDSWRIAAELALLFYVEFLAVSVQNRLASCAPSFQLDGDSGGAHWCNHCERCGAVLDDQELFCEPGGAFLPTSESAAGLIHWEPIEAAFEAVAGGYAHEPSFLSGGT